MLHNNKNKEGNIVELTVLFTHGLKRKWTVLV